MKNYSYSVTYKFLIAKSIDHGKRGFIFTYEYDTFRYPYLFGLAR